MYLGYVSKIFQTLSANNRKNIRQLFVSKVSMQAREIKWSGSAPKYTTIPHNPPLFDIKHKHVNFQTMLLQISRGIIRKTALRSNQIRHNPPGGLANVHNMLWELLQTETIPSHRNETVSGNYINYCSCNLSVLRLSWHEHHTVKTRVT